MTPRPNQEDPQRLEEPVKQAVDQDPDRDLEAARQVLRLEATGLDALATSLGGEFNHALDLLATVSGRITVTGMGKAGHVARKIAATLASTGAPAQFVHPGEASHGDLGMIAPGDAVLAMSNSGDTTELNDVILYTRRFGIPLVAMTAKASSTLAEGADVTLLLPRAPEACPMGLAPTTSTTMHPGGALGRKLLRVSDVMHGPEVLPLCQPDTAMSEAILIMTQGTFGCVGITDDSGALIGIITDGDLRRHMDPGLLAVPAREVMTGPPRTIRTQALATEALGVMNGVRNERPITSLFVVENGSPVGIVHIHDCLRAGVA